MAASSAAARPTSRSGYFSGGKISRIGDNPCASSAGPSLAAQPAQDARVDSRMALASDIKLLEEVSSNQSMRFFLKTVTVMALNNDSQINVANGIVPTNF